MNVRLQYDTVFTAGIFYGGQLMMNNYRLKLDIITISSEVDDHNIALDRMKFFIHNQLSHSVFINSADTDRCQKLISAGIKITNLPEEPVDQIIGIMLYCKLNAMVDDCLAVHQITISSELGDNIAYFHCDDESLGPLETPGWYTNNDTSHCDLANFEIKVVDIQQRLSWKDLGLSWKINQATEDNNSKDNTVLFADFTKDETR
jgi:hypothetical protein